MTAEGKIKIAIFDMIDLAPIGALLFIYGFLLEYL